MSISIFWIEVLRTVIALLIVGVISFLATKIFSTLKKKRHNLLKILKKINKFHILGLTYILFGGFLIFFAYETLNRESVYGSLNAVALGAETDCDKSGCYWNLTSDQYVYIPIRTSSNYFVSIDYVYKAKDDLNLNVVIGQETYTKRLPLANEFEKSTHVYEIKPNISGLQHLKLNPDNGLIIREIIVRQKLDSKTQLYSIVILGVLLIVLGIIFIFKMEEWSKSLEKSIKKKLKKKKKEVKK